MTAPTLFEDANDNFGAQDSCELSDRHSTLSAKDPNHGKSHGFVLLQENLRLVS